MGAVQFPVTKRTWLADHIDGGAERFAAVRCHVMRVYEAPLVAYAARSKYRGRVEPEDAVHAFFLARLADDRYLARWTRSGLPLRRWLAIGLGFWLRQSLQLELRRTDAIGIESEADVDWLPGVEAEPYAAYCARYRTELVARATEDAAEVCRERGLGQHWRAFLALRRDSIAMLVLSEELGESPARITVLARSGQRHFSAAVRRVIALEGVPAGRVDDVIRELLSA